MFHPQPLHLLPGLGIIDEALQQLRPSWLAASLLPNAGSAPAKGAQVMFHPQPLHLLPGLGIIDEALQKLRPSWLAAGLWPNAGSAPNKGRTSNVPPSTITSAP